MYLSVEEETTNREATECVFCNGAFTEEQKIKRPRPTEQEHIGEHVIQHVI